MERLVLDPYFIHPEQVLALLGSRAEVARRDIDRRGAYLPSAPGYILANHLASALAELGTAELQRAVYQGSLTEGQLVGIQQAFYFRRAKERDREGDRPIDLRGKLNTDGGVAVVGTLNSERCPTASGAGNLSRRARVYAVGTVTPSRRHRSLTSASSSTEPIRYQWSRLMWVCGYRGLSGACIGGSTGRAVGS